MKNPDAPEDSTNRDGEPSRQTGAPASAPNSEGAVRDAYDTASTETAASTSDRNGWQLSLGRLMLPTQRLHFDRDAVKVATRGASTTRFRLIDDEEMLGESDQEYLIDRVCSVQSLVLTHGQSGHGKSFLGIDAAFSVASGTSWYGHAVNTPGPAVYIAAEGQPGLKDRIRAWKSHKRIEGRVIGVRFILEAVDPLNQDDIKALQAQLRLLPERQRLVVVDTWSACLAAGDGDENITKDTSRAISAWRRIVAEFGATVWIIHHEGHAAPGRARGSSALKAAAETEIAIIQKHDVVTVKNLKQRDGTLFEEFHLRLRVVPLGGDRTSCVLVPAGGGVETTGPRRLPERAEKALAALCAATKSGLTRSDWCNTSPVKGSTFDRAIADLLTAEYVAKPDDGRGALYVVTDAGRDYHHRHVTPSDTTSGGNDGGHDHHHQPSPPRRGDGDGGDGGDQDQSPIPGSCLKHNPPDPLESALGLTSVGYADTPRWWRKCTCAPTAHRRGSKAAKSSPASGGGVEAA